MLERTARPSPYTRTGYVRSLRRRDEKGAKCVVDMHLSTCARHVNNREAAMLAAAAREPHEAAVKPVDGTSFEIFKRSKKDLGRPWQSGKPCSVDLETLLSTAEQEVLEAAGWKKLLSRAVF